MSGPFQMHHKDPAQKAFTVSIEWDRPWLEVLEELTKCELVCELCHRDFHRARHGLGMYSHQKCRCKICKDAWSKKTREYKLKNKQALEALK